MLVDSLMSKLHVYFPITFMTPSASDALTFLGLGNTDKEC